MSVCVSRVRSACVCLRSHHLRADTSFLSSVSKGSGRREGRRGRKRAGREAPQPGGAALPAKVRCPPQPHCPLRAAREGLDGRPRACCRRGGESGGRPATWHVGARRGHRAGAGAAHGGSRAGRGSGAGRAPTAAFLPGRESPGAPRPRPHFRPGPARPRSPLPQPAADPEGGENRDPGAWSPLLSSGRPLRAGSRPAPDVPSRCTAQPPLRTRPAPHLHPTLFSSPLAPPPGNEGWKERGGMS